MLLKGLSLSIGCNVQSRCFPIILHGLLKSNAVDRLNQKVKSLDFFYYTAVAINMQVY